MPAATNDPILLRLQVFVLLRLLLSAQPPTTLPNTPLARVFVSRTVGNLPFIPPYTRLTPEDTIRVILMLHLQESFVVLAEEVVLPGWIRRITFVDICS